MNIAEQLAPSNISEQLKDLNISIRISTPNQTIGPEIFHSYQDAIDYLKAVRDGNLDEYEVRE